MSRSNVTPTNSISSAMKCLAFSTPSGGDRCGPSGLWQHAQPIAEFGVSVLKKSRGRTGRTPVCPCRTPCTNRAVKTMYIHALTKNSAMLKIARSAGARVVYHGSEAEAHLQLRAPDMKPLGQRLSNHFAELDYLLKKASAPLPVSKWCRERRAPHHLHGLFPLFLVACSTPLHFTDHGVKPAFRARARRQRSFWQRFKSFSPAPIPRRPRRLARAEDKAIISPEALSMLEGVIRMSIVAPSATSWCRARAWMCSTLSPFEALLDQVIRTAHSRFPVYEGTRGYHRRAHGQGFAQAAALAHPQPARPAAACEFCP